MPRNSSGIFSLLPGTAAAAGEVIEAEKYNARDEDIASALTASLPRDGSAGMTDALTMGNNRITALADATAATDAVNRRVAFPTVLARSTVYTVLSTDRARVIAADTSSAAFNITLPSLESGDSGWFVDIVRVAGANAVTVLPPSGTINGAASIAVSETFTPLRFEWNGTAFVAFNGPTTPADGSVTTAKIVDANVTTAKIADVNVTTGKIADSAVTTGKIADVAVTFAKVATAAIASQAQAEAGTATDVLMTPQRARQSVEAFRGYTEHDVLATTSGTDIDFTGLPAGIKEVKLVFDSVNLSGTDSMLIRFGTSAAFIASGYTSKSSAGDAITVSTSSFVLRRVNSDDAVQGTYDFIRSSGDVWIGSGVANRENTNSHCLVNGGRVNLGAELTRVRITRSGSNTFSGGQVILLYR